MADLNEVLGTYSQRGARAVEKLQVAYERKITASWKGALDEVRLQMGKVYEKYAVSGNLSLAEMTQYNRLATLEKQVLQTINPAVRQTLGTIERLRPDQYNAAFFHQAWAIDNAVGVRLGWGTLNREAVLRNLASNFYHISTDRYGFDAKLTVRTALNKGLSLGKSYPQMARDIKDAFDIEAWKGLRIARTEGQTAMAAGTDDAYLVAQEKGIAGKVIWDATLDDATREDHAAMDGAVRQDDGFFDGPGDERAPYPAWQGLSAGQRISCRCRLRFEVEDFAPPIRRTRDQGIIPYQPYAQWDAARKKG